MKSWELASAHQRNQGTRCQKDFRSSLNGLVDNESQPERYYLATSKRGT